MGADSRLLVVSLLIVALAVLPSCTSQDSQPDPAGPELEIEGNVVPGPARVRADGIQPDQNYLLFQCRDRGQPINLDHDCDTTKPASVSTRSDAQGEIAATVNLQPVMGVDERTEVDCIATPCVLALSDGMTALASTPIEWDQGAQAAPAPRLEIQRLIFEDGSIRGVATVHGEAFPPGARAAVVQCPAAGAEESSDVDAGDCLYTYSTSVKADSGGRWTAKAIVFRRFQRSNGKLIRCDEAPWQCALAIPWPRSLDYRMARVTFDKAPSCSGRPAGPRLDGGRTAPFAGCVGDAPTWQRPYAGPSKVSLRQAIGDVLRNRPGLASSIRVTVRLDARGHAAIDFGAPFTMNDRPLPFADGSRLDQALTLTVHSNADVNSVDFSVAGDCLAYAVAVGGDTCATKKF